MDKVRHHGNHSLTVDVKKMWENGDWLPIWLPLFNAEKRDSGANKLS